MTGKIRLGIQNLPPAQSKLKSSTNWPGPGPDPNLFRGPYCETYDVT